MKIAITRTPSPKIQDCELTFLKRQKINFEQLLAQHEGYRASLKQLGYALEDLPPLPQSPDGTFVEDTAVVLPELAVISRPGAESRAQETDSVAPVLKRHRKNVFSILAPGTMDGGDVLRIGKTLYVGVGGRTNEKAVTQFKKFVGDFGYSVKSVFGLNCLHLKTAVTAIGLNTVVLNPEWVDEKYFSSFQVIHVDPTEPFAGNVLEANKQILYPKAHSRTAERLERAGISVTLVDFSEIAKAEAGLTCCSILFESPPQG